MMELDTLLVQSTRTVRNAFTDIRFGGLLCLNTRTWRKHGLFDLQNSDYVALAQIFKNRIAPSDVLVDIGCRKGRVINWWLSQGLRNQIVGIELDADIAEETRKRLHRHKNVNIITGDALDNIPPEGTIFYLFNPFDEPIVQGFKARMLETFGPHANVTIIYHKCKHIGLFEQDPAWSVEQFNVSGHPRLPFPPFAVIKLRQPPVQDRLRGKSQAELKSN